MMPRRLLGMALAAAGMAVWASPAIVAAQPAKPGATAKGYKPKLTAWGEPDLRGTWPIDYLNGLVLERDPKYGNRAYLTDAEYAEAKKRQDALQARYANDDKDGKIGRGHWDEAGEATRQTSLIVERANGRLPAMTEEGKRRSALMRSSWRRNQSYDTPLDFDSWDRCITRGLPASMLPMHYNNGIRVWQSPGLVAIELEMIHETRLIPTDGKARASRAITNWMGESRGHWENGNTLVVETTNFRPGPSATNTVTVGSPAQNDTPVSETARLTEWFTITGPNSVTYRATWTDPVVFTAPWTVQLDWRRHDDYGMFEYACHEGDVQIRNYITASRAQRAPGAAKAGE
ncbi:MAG: hypothetical protein J7485_11825 [Sphingobium sp.]|nr:hypothetical protein [Sphingobium sp.]